LRALRGCVSSGAERLKQALWTRSKHKASIIRSRSLRHRLWDSALRTAGSLIQDDALCGNIESAKRPGGRCRGSEAGPVRIDTAPFFMKQERSF
jgi:hypothetical protein